MSKLGLMGAGNTMLSGVKNTPFDIPLYKTNGTYLDGGDTYPNNVYHTFTSDALIYTLNWSLVLPNWVRNRPLATSMYGYFLAPHYIADANGLIFSIKDGNDTVVSEFNSAGGISRWSRHIGDYDILLWMSSSTASNNEILQTMLWDFESLYGRPQFIKAGYKFNVYAGETFTGAGTEIPFRITGVYI